MNITIGPNSLLYDQLYSDRKLLSADDTQASIFTLANLWLLLTMENNIEKDQPSLEEEKLKERVKVHIPLIPGISAYEAELKVPSGMAATSIGMILASATLLRSFRKLIEVLSDDEKAPEDKTIADLLYEKRRKELQRLNRLPILVVAVIAVIAIPFDISVAFGPYYIGVIFIPSLVTWLRNRVIKYRIERGYYGSNYREARELIEFIEEISDDIPPSDGGNEIQAFPEALQKSKSSAVDGVLGKGVSA